MKIKLPSIGLILLSVATIFTIVGFILYFSTFSVFNYQQSKVTIACTIMSLWGMIFLIVNGLFAGEKPVAFNIFYIINCFALAFAFSYFLIPCLSPIGVYFTVNMGDMETYALGVPRCIAGCVFYVLALILNIVASFFKVTKGGQINE